MDCRSRRPLVLLISLFFLISANFSICAQNLSSIAAIIIQDKSTEKYVDDTPVPPYKPAGAAGKSFVHPDVSQESSNEVVEDRWRIGFPEWNRTIKGNLISPYRQNVLKGDYPIFGQNTFFSLMLESETTTKLRRVPVPSDVSSSRPDSEEFFGRGGQFLLNQNFVISAELFHGNTSFKPPDWRVRFTPVFNINYLHVRENGIVNRDVRAGTDRLDGHIGLQEGFFEFRLGDTPKIFPFLRGRDSSHGHSPFFDSTSLRLGIQQFNSDFRGLLFFDNNLGARLFGNFRNNKWQFNLAYFYMLEKDTNSGLNTLDKRNQRVYIANLYRQDFIKLGYTTQFSLHYNDDQPDVKYDVNNFLVRPQQVGDVRPHSVKVGYLGWTGDGHFRRLNINHAFYEALGHDSRNPIAGQSTLINAQLAAFELSVDRDWQRFRGSFLFASGDSNPKDRTAKGFDSILDHQFFAGSENSFWNSQEVRLTQTAVALTTQDSLLPSLRSSKLQGQANFVNPGILVFNIGYDAELTPKLRLNLNFNYLRFHHTGVLENLLFQPKIGNNIGLDYGGGITYRPLLSENIIIKAGASAMNPLRGFKDIYTSNCSDINCGQSSKFLFSIYSKVLFTF